MADQSVKITSLPDNSRSRVAYDLMHAVQAALPSGKVGVERIEQILNLYAACYDVAGGSPVNVSKLK